MEIELVVRNWNSFADFVNNELGLIIAKEGELPTSFFDETDDAKIDEYFEIAQTDDLVNHIDELIEFHKKLVKSYQAYKSK